MCEHLLVHFDLNHSNMGRIQIDIQGTRQKIFDINRIMFHCCVNFDIKVFAIF